MRKTGLKILGELKVSLKPLYSSLGLRNIIGEGSMSYPLPTSCAYGGDVGDFLFTRATPRVLWPTVVYINSSITDVIGRENPINLPEIVCRHLVVPSVTRAVVRWVGTTFFYCFVPSI